MESLHPLDAELNLAKELYSHELRRRVAVEASKSSFDEVVRMLKETTGAQVGKRQVEELVIRAAEDFDAFYKERYEYRPSPQTGSILVMNVASRRRGVAIGGWDCHNALEMPKLYEYLGIIVLFYSNEHEPIHVHGKCQGRESRAELVLENGDVVQILYSSLKGKRPLRESELQNFETLVEHYSKEIVQKWIDYFVLHKQIHPEKITQRIQ